MSTAASESTKKQRTNPLLATHSGTFHADESLAIFLLRLLPAYKGADLVRTRNPDLLKEGTVVVDVGGVYDPETNRYDHHQRGFNEVFGHGFVTKLSSAGLVYKHFGPEIISTVLSIPVTDPQVQQLYLKLYEDFVEALDGIDNGISAQSGPSLYRSRTDLSSRIANLNPRWNEPSSDAVLDSQFSKASELAGSEFLAALDYLAKAWLPARDIVVKAFKARQEVHPSGKIIVFDEFCPWKQHIHSLEKDLSIAEDDLPLYVLYPETAESNTNWRVQAIPKSETSFESRKALPEAWRGIRDSQLDELSGIPGCIFVHAAGFIGGNKTKEGALQMAVKALEL